MLIIILLYYKKIGYYKIKYLSNNLSRFLNIIDLNLSLNVLYFLIKMIIKLKIFKVIN